MRMRGRVGGRRTVVGVATLTLLTMAALGATPRVDAAALATAATGAWSGYATGSAFHVNAIQVAAGGPLVENTSLAFAGASVNSRGQATGINNEMGLGVQTSKAERESYGRGSGLEVGLNKTLPNNPDTNQAILGALAEAGALPLEPAASPPNPYQTALVTRDLLAQPANPAVYAGILRGQAVSMWNDRYLLPMLGNPLGFGLGFADDVQLVNSGTARPDGTFTAPVVATDTTAAGPERTTSQSFSVTYLVNNGDGTCGLASETHQTIAPIRLNLPPDTNPANDTTIEILGEFVLRAVATGKVGGSAMTYAPTSGGPSTPVLRIIQGTTVTNVLNTQQLFGNAGLTLPGALGPIIQLAVGEDPRAIAAPTASPDPESKPTVTQTEVAGAVDVVRLRLLQPGHPAAGLLALDLRLGHMEAKVTVPAGGMNCEIPVRKEAVPVAATGGQDITFIISIPVDETALIPFPCDLSAIRVVDTVGIEEGAPKFTVISGTGPKGEVGIVNGNTVTFENIGSYTPGQTPLLARVVVRIAPDTGVGKLKDDVAVTAIPNNCKARDDAVGRALGGAGFFGASSARLTGAGLEGAGSGSGQLRGDTSLSGPTVNPVLPITGPARGALPIAAAAMVLGALAFRRWRGGFRPANP